ncbi:hypothetical protein BV898_17038 [Hypsibius exemplaris]|uniref:Peptidase S1 domain-containing protein n=1 Tax=Hypsibius exemplaris TaxID=2072580 RepID=A0A9X6NGH7_HYPEX|nr:hypothetical protein BV898_17038 [Hypsibius exemplaris]
MANFISRFVLLGFFISTLWITSSHVSGFKIISGKGVGGVRRFRPTVTTSTTDTTTDTTTTTSEPNTKKRKNISSTSLDPFKVCGLTGDLLIDSFGLAGQFSALRNIRRIQRDDALEEDGIGSEEEEEVEWIDVEGRSFRNPKRRKIQNGAKESATGESLVSSTSATTTRTTAKSSPPKAVRVKSIKTTTTTTTSTIAPLVVNPSASTSRFCWQVLITATTPSGVKQTCSGAIVGTRTVLTVGQCLLDAASRDQLQVSAFKVIVGMPNDRASSSGSDSQDDCTETFSVSAATLHPQYNDGTNDNDIAVLSLTNAIDIDNKPCACMLCMKNRQPTVGETCIVSGFGNILTGVAGITGSSDSDPVPFKWTTQKIVDQKNTTVCPALQDARSGAMTGANNFYCTSGPADLDSCVADQGSALVCFDPDTVSHYLAGLMSFSSATCNHALGMQSVKLANYLDWILEVVRPKEEASTTTTTTSRSVAPAGQNVVRKKQAITKQCGLPGNGVLDAFGIVSQFTSKSIIRRRFPGGPQMHETERRRVESAEIFGRIIGGADSTLDQICWQGFIVANLPDGSGAVTCGAMIIGTRTILTTATCLLDLNLSPIKASAISVVVGARNTNAPNSGDPTGCEEEYQVQTVTNHPQFIYNTANNDIAVLTLSTAIDIQNKALPRDPIPLKWVNQTINQQNTATSGNCAVFQDTDGTETDVNNFICSNGAVGQDQCVGDNGGPLTCFNPVTRSYYAAGIISFGTANCGTGGAGQSVKLDNYLSWITANSLPGDVVIQPSTPATTTTPTPTTTTTSTTTTTTQTTTVPTTSSPTTTTSSPTTTTSSPATTTTSRPTTGTSTSTTSTPLVTFIPPPGPKRCGLPGNNAVDPFGIVGQFGGKTSKDLLARLSATLLQKRVSRPLDRIIGGFDALPAEICWQAFILGDLPSSQGAVYCGGIIIGSQTILTTASCILDLNHNPIAASAIFVTVGAINDNAPASNANDPLQCAQEYTVQTVTVHPQFAYSTNDNDIALLTLSAPIDIQNKPCACTLCLTDRVPQRNEVCVMSGYGEETNDGTALRNPVPLKWVKQTIQQQGGVSSTLCASFTDPSGSRQTNLANFLCSAGVVGQDQCISDNGGPLACYNPTTGSYYAAGIISFSSSPCGTGDGGQSVKIVNYLQWIADNSLAGDVAINSTTDLAV